MFRSIYERFQRALVSLRFSILVIFVSLFVTAILFLIYINYNRSTVNLLYVSNQLMEEVSFNLYTKFNNEIEKAERDNKISAQLIQHNLLNADNINEMTAYTVDLAKQFYIVQAAFWGDEKGNYVKAEYESDDTLSSDIVDRNKIPPERTLIYRDKNLKITKSVNSANTGFDPRVRPWYIQAKNAQKTIWTDIYKFLPSGYLGITIATPVYKEGNLRGVFGLDIGLEWISWYIGEQKISPNALTFVVTKEGKILAGSQKLKNVMLQDVHHAQTPVLAKAFDIYNQTKQTNFNFDLDGLTYLADFRTIPQFAMHGWLIGIVVPKDDLTFDLKKQSMLDAAIGFCILILGLILVSHLVTRVVEPIKRLVRQTTQIKNFDLQEEHISSNIKEIKLLSAALNSMVRGLKSFQRYVPAALVRQLIETGQDVRMGGAKKSLTILFSDIENFTKFSEKMDPDELLKNVCEYFEVLSKTIVNEKGTIDKYIGDSIMAFWGAPLPVEQPCHSAARAALGCIKRSNELQKSWKAQGRNIFKTRIGIHMGTVVVGNIGSSERINYTALGDAINVTRRLEMLNKIYGTTITLSDDVYRVIKDEFVIRKIDFVTLRGKLSGTEVYELLAENKNELSFDADKYIALFEKGFAAYQSQQWQTGIEAFESCLVIFPKDTVAPIFIKRCQHFQMNPPVVWDGMWHI